MKKILKRLLCIVVVLICIMPTLSGCSVVSKWTNFYKEDLLETRGLKGLKKPEYKYKYSDGILCTLNGDIELDIFNEYVNYVYGFLNERFTHIGVAGVVEYNSFFGGAADFDFIACENILENFKEENETYVKYEFIYFEENPEVEYEENKKNPDENGNVTVPSTGDHVTLIYYKTPITRNVGSEEKPKKYNL